MHPLVFNLEKNQTLSVHETDLDLVSKLFMTQSSFNNSQVVCGGICLYFKFRMVDYVPIGTYLISYCIL